MATKEDSATKATPAKPAAKAPEPAAKPDTTPGPAAETVEDGDPIVSTCVVNGGRGMHVGNAVNGKVCSYHAMHYDRNGNRR